MIRRRSRQAFSPAELAAAAAIAARQLAAALAVRGLAAGTAGAAEVLLLGVVRILVSAESAAWWSLGGAVVCAAVQPANLITPGKILVFSLIVLQDA